MKIILNAREVDTKKEVVSYEDILAMAGKKGVATVTYHSHEILRNGRRVQTGGSLTRGQMIRLSEGMVLNCTHTNNA